ncbi:MAG: TolC family protein [Myxococcota bacterium]
MRRLAFIAAFFATASLVPLSPPAHAQDDDSDSADDDEEQRKKRLARLGSGQIKHPEPIGEVYTLDALANRAVEVHPLLVAQEAKRFYAELRQDEANWAFFPKFEITSALTVVPNAPDPEAVNNAGSALQQYIELDVGPLSTTSLQILFPIYTFGKVGTARDLAKLGIDQADLEMRKERVKLAAQIREAYYGLQLGGDLALDDVAPIIHDRHAHFAQL